MEQKKRICCTDKSLSSTFRGSRQICIPISPSEYETIIDDTAQFRMYVDQMIVTHRELFPSAISDGYTLHSFCSSTKQELKLRRIQLKATHHVFTIRPSFVMPYMIGMTSDVEHALLLRYFGVPFWVLTHIFGQDDMYWHRVEQRLSKNSLVGTTVNSPDNLPQDVLADEKHSRRNGSILQPKTIP